MMYRYVWRSKFVETLKVIWTQYNANIIAHLNMYKMGTKQKRPNLW